MDAAHIATLERIQGAMQVLSEIGRMAAGLPEDPQRGAEMLAHLAIANSYLAEYAKHLMDGKEPYDAMLAAARGELKLTTNQRDLWRALTPPTQPE